MNRTRSIPALGALLLAAAACAPEIPSTASVPKVATVVFDPNTGEIPLPNALALSDQAMAGLPDGAQKELLQEFKAAGGFPNDQEVPITVGLVDQLIASSGQVTETAPGIDPESLNASTVFVWGLTAAGAGIVPIETEVDVGTTRTTVSLHRAGRQPWEPGLYYGFVRGGAFGLQTADGRAVYASQVFNLVAQGEDMTTEKNIGILRAQVETYEEAYTLASTLNGLIFAYSTPPAPGVPSAFAVADTRFPHQELAALTVFAVAPGLTATGVPPKPTIVDLDPARGLVPLPIDLLRVPGPGGKLTHLAACSLAGGSVADCPAGAAGFEALDGFGTTAPLLAPTSDLVDATSVTADTVQLWDLSDAAAPVLVDPDSYLTEPCEVTDSGLSPLVTLWPAAATSCDTTSVFRTRPLKDATDYAVVITTGVKDKTGKALGQGTVGKMLLLTHPISEGGKSQVTGVDDATAFGLEAMRLQLQPVLTAGEYTRSGVAMAYTFRTQTIAETAVQLAALPYTQAAATGLPGTVTTFTPAAAFARYGVAATVPSSNIGEVMETTLTTFNLLDPATGAFSATLTAAAETVPVLIATPKLANSNLATCSGAMAPFAPLKCAPVVVFRHGLGGGRTDMLTVADGLAAKGLVVIAIDAAKHGDRALCPKGDTTTTIGAITVPICADGTSACTSPLPAGAQGDAQPPGTCGAAGYAVRPVSSACLADPAGCGWDGKHGIPFVSGNFVISANFFRTRDSFRQDLIDQSQLVRALAFVPSGAPPTGHPVFDHMAAGGFVIDPTRVSYVSQSLGSLQGAMNVASNPRISSAVLNVGGGTMVDVFTTSPAFEQSIDRLLTGLGIVRGANSAYIQLIEVTKLILDPADPINYAGHITADTLPNLLPPLGGNPDGSVPQAAKSLLVQAAFCDQVVPNPFTYLLGSTAAVGPLPGTPGFGGPGTFQLYMTGTSAPDQAAFDSCTGGFGSTPLTPWAVEHGFITNWDDALQTSTAQAAAAGFVAAGTHPNSLVVLP